MKKHIENYDVFKEPISKNNVLAMAEQLAMYETRFLIGYMGSRMQKIYADLCVDVRRKNDVNHTFSDSYDLVREGALFLCKYYRKRLSDVLTHDKKGFVNFTTYAACIQEHCLALECKPCVFIIFFIYRLITFRYLLCHRCNRHCKSSAHCLSSLNLC